jgi:DNA polymerase-3 subunit epsilon
MTMREIVFDTETTGRDAERGDRIVEIGCVEVFNYAPTGRTLHFYLNPERDVPDEVVRVHGLTGVFLRDKPLFGSVADAFIEFIGDARLVAHNAEFDRRFLNAELARLGRQTIGSERFIDTLPMARRKFPGAANSLDALAKRYQLDQYGFDLSARKGAGGHGALIDARILAEVYLQLNGGREQMLSFEAENMRFAGSGRTGKARVRRKRRTMELASRLSASEQDAHAAFVAELGAEALWLKFAKRGS